MNRLMRLIAALLAFAPLGAFAQISGGTGLSGGPIFLNITGSTQCLHANTNGVISGTGSDCAGGAATGANPTGTVGLSTVNGSAATFLRSDGAPPLSQSITPTWTGLHKFTLADFALLGASTGYTLLESGLSGAGNNTLTLPTTASDTLAALGTIQSWTAVQTFTNSDIALLGSSTGKTTFTSANAGASNFTLTFPAATDTLGALGTIQTWPAAQTFSALLTASAGATISGAATSINDSSNFNTNINTTTSTGTVTIGQNSATPGSIVLKGPVSFQAGTAYSAASWGLTSPVWNAAALTLNDTTASGTVTNDVAYSIQAPTFTSTGGASTTITNAVGLWLGLPVCSGGVVCTNKYALLSTGGIIVTAGQLQSASGVTFTGGTANINANANQTTNINTGTSTGTVNIGQNGASSSTINLNGPVNFNAGTNFSGATWGTTSPIWNAAALTINDTTASGTVTQDVAWSMQAPNFTSTGGASTTITSAIGLYLAAPTCTTVICTNKYSLYSAGQILAANNIVGQLGAVINGGAVALNKNSNNTTEVGDGSTTSLVTVGGGSNGVVINSNQSGSIKDTALMSTGTKFTLGSGTGSCTTTSTTVGGAAAGSFVCTGTAGAGTIVITINGATGLTAPNGWACTGSDITSGTAFVQSGTAATTCTLKGTTAANTDVITFIAIGY